MSEIINKLDLKSMNISEDKKNKLKELFPSVIQWIDNYKNEYGYESFSVMLQLKESEIFIEKLWKSIKEKGLFCISRHDSLIYKMENQSEIESIVINYFKEIGLDCSLKLSNGRRIEVESCGVLDSEFVKIYTKDEIKNFLCDMKNIREYYGLRSSIDFLLSSLDNKTVESANEHYHFIKNKEILNYKNTIIN